MRIEQKTIAVLAAGTTNLIDDTQNDIDRVEINDAQQAPTLDKSLGATAHHQLTGE